MDEKGPDGQQFLWMALASSLTFRQNNVALGAYQPKATTLTCVLVRVVALVLIFE